MAHEWIDPFLAELAKCPNVAAACRAAGISRVLAYRRRGDDPDFAAAWEAAQETSTDDLVGECYRRARSGCERPVFYKGDECGHVREYSDTLAIFLLKAHRPAVYRETVRQEHTGADGGPVETIVLYLPANGRDPEPPSDPPPAGAPGAVA